MMAFSNENTGGAMIFTNRDVAAAPVEVEQVQVDLVDNILPSDAVIDFALIDVERLEVECLEGMKAVIRRSPGIVMMVEWSGASVNTANIDSSIDQLLDWLIAEKFTFWELNKHGLENC